MRYSYLTNNEINMPSDEVDGQILLGLESCKTKGDALPLLRDVRKHERFIMELEIREEFGRMILEIMSKSTPDSQVALLQTAKVNTLHFLLDKINGRLRK